MCWDPQDNQEVQYRLSYLNCLLKDWIPQETLKIPEILSTSTTAQGARATEQPWPPSLAGLRYLCAAQSGT